MFKYYDNNMEYYINLYIYIYIYNYKLSTGYGTFYTNCSLMIFSSVSAPVFRNIFFWSNWNVEKKVAKLTRHARTIDLRESQHFRGNVLGCSYSFEAIRTLKNASALEKYGEIVLSGQVIIVGKKRNELGLMVT